MKIWCWCWFPKHYTTCIGDQKSLPMANNPLKSSQEVSEQSRPSLHKSLRPWVRTHPKKFMQTSPKTWGDKFLGIPFLASNVCVCDSGSCIVNMSVTKSNASELPYQPKHLHVGGEDSPLNLGVALPQHCKRRGFGHFAPYIWGWISIGQKRVQNEKSPKFSNIRPEVCSERCSEFSPKFSKIFCVLFLGTDTTRSSPKYPPFFNAKSRGKLKENSQKLAGEQANFVMTPFPLQLAQRRYSQKQ